MQIVMASSEAVPFAKTGGLADVASGLSKALASLGHEVTLIIPCYRRQIPPERRGQAAGNVQLTLRGQVIPAALLATTLDDSPVRTILVDQPNFFDRSGLYGEAGFDYFDNPERFAFFSRAVLAALPQLGIRPEIIHVNDWQTGLIPALIDYDRQTARRHDAATVLTVHNLAFQGLFPKWNMDLTELPLSYFHPRCMEFFGKMSLLKAGITLADMVTTVSPTYAREICTPEFGCGLEGVLSERQDRLVGILNGVDTGTWNPAIDRYLPTQYDRQNWRDGKSRCKQALQQELNLPARADAMLLGMVSRLTDQKGFDLIAAKADELLRADIQLAILGTGDPRYEEWGKQLQRQHPHQVALFIGFDEGLAHRIEAGADAYLMPSRFEPCGLNQMYSLLYGTPPIVHAVGGLADSVTDATPENLSAGTATGFCFDRYDPEEFLQAVWRAVGMFTHHRDQWDSLVERGMSRDVSWQRSAQQYEGVYERARQSAQRSR